MQHQRALVLDTNRQPLMPCHPARARELLNAGKAAVFRRYPFTIILKEREGGDTQPVQVKIDPGSATTGIALVGDFKRGKKVLWGANLTHRGLAIKAKLEARRGLRSSRRHRTLRYRPSRFLNRTRPDGWLAPSLMHQVLTIRGWVARLVRCTPADRISMELVRFDTHKMHNPEVSGVAYQHGTLFGIEVKHYLLAKWQHSCAYCGATGVPLQVEHITPRKLHGSNRVSNLTIACVPCNQRKGAQRIEAFLANQPELLDRITSQAKTPLRDVAAVNSTRWKLHQTLQTLGFPIETGTGGRTAWNRTISRLPKDHWTDAACVGESGAQLRAPRIAPLRITCVGRGNRQACGTDKFGFPIRHRTRQKRFFGFQTGDIVRAVVPRGKYAGTHSGRIAVRARPSFRLGSIDVHSKHLTAIQRADGYAYSF